MENEKMTPKEVKSENKERSKISLPIIVGAAAGGVAVIAIVIALILGGGKKDGTPSGGNGGTTDPGASDVSEDSILNKDNIDPDGWTKVDK